MSRFVILLLFVPLAGCVSFEPIEFSEGHPANFSAPAAPRFAAETPPLDYELPQPASPLEESPQPAAGENQHAAANASSLYTCPMHPEIIQDKPGNCPVCGMSLVPKMTDASKPEDLQPQASSLYTCPMHPQIVQDKPGNCPICGMSLVPKKTDAAMPEQDQPQAVEPMHHDHGAEP